MGKKQHYVPQFYLRNFSDNGKTIIQYILDKKIYLPISAIKSVAYQEYLYGKEQNIESMFSMNEAEWKRIISTIITDQEVRLTEQDFVTFALFITLSIHRTARSSEESAALVNVQGLAFLEAGIDAGEIPQRNLTGYHVETEVPVALALAEALPIIGALIGLGCLCIINDSGIGFITSDSPVVKYNQLYTSRNFQSGYGYCNSGLQICVPLSPDICVCFYDSEVYDVLNVSEQNRLRLTSKKHIKKLNTLFAVNAHRYIYSQNHTKKYLETISQKHVPYSAEENFKRIHLNGEHLIAAVPHTIRAKINLPYFRVKPHYQSCVFPDDPYGLQRIGCEDKVNELRKIREEKLKSAWEMTKS